MSVRNFFYGYWAALKAKVKKWVNTDVNDNDSDYIPPWKPMPFDETFRETLFSIPLEKHAKVIIMLRYVELVTSVKHKHRSVFASYNILRVTTLLSGLVTPVLFSITNDVPNKAALFWVTLVTSLLGSISNAWLEYFSIIKMHYTYLSASELLESEGWHFCSLTGPYARYPDHQSCWREFISNTEKIHNSSVRQYMLNSQPQNRSSSGKDLMKSAATTKHTDEYVVDSSVEGSTCSNNENEPIKHKTGLRLRKRLCGITPNTTEENNGSTRFARSTFPVSPTLLEGRGRKESSDGSSEDTPELGMSASSGDIPSIHRSVSGGDEVVLNMENDRTKDE